MAPSELLPVLQYLKQHQLRYNYAVYVLPGLLSEVAPTAAF